MVIVLLVALLVHDVEDLVLEHVWEGAACEQVGPGSEQAWGIIMIMNY